MYKRIKDIEGLEKFDGYAIDRKGQIYSYHKKGMNRKYESIDWDMHPTILKTSVKSSGYRHLALYDTSGNPKWFMLHRLLALAFMPNPKNLEQVNHKDRNKLNNNLDNLEWVSRSQNVKHAFRIGLQDHARSGVAKGVDMLTKQGEYIRSFDSLAEAAAFVGLKPSSKSSISRVCAGEQKTSAGYKWRYSTKGSTTSL